MSGTNPKMTFSEKDVSDILSKTGGDLVKAEAEMKRLEALRKDSMPPEGRPGPNQGRLYQNGPFGYIDDEITSAMITGGSPLMNWIPTKAVKSRYEHLAHLEWVGAKGFDATEETYPEWLNSLEIGECGYGPTTTWSGFKWQQSGGTFSWQTEMMKLYEDSGLHYHEEQPSYTLRNASGAIDGGGNPLDTDKDWAVARVLYAMETHADYNLKHGDEKNSQMEWDGIDQIVRPGYIQSRVVGNGIAHWADPIYVNGAGMSIAQVFQTLRVVVRRLRRRARDRNWQVAESDMVILMPTTMWDNLAEFVAAGALYAYTNQFGFDGKMTLETYDRRYDTVRSGGIGFGSIKIDGFSVPVMTDNNMGINTTITDGGNVTSAISGDIYVLTRRASGMSLWEQQFVDWNQLDYPNWNEEKFTLQNGLVRAGWVTEASKCYLYFAEMGGRNVCRMLPLQGRITNVTIATLDNLENESGAFWSPDYYASRELGGLTGVDSTV